MRSHYQIGYRGGIIKRFTTRFINLTTATLFFATTFAGAAPLLFPATASAAGTNDVWITAAMPDPSPSDPEYVTLKNVSTSPINLNGWKVDSHIITAPGDLAAGDSATVCENGKTASICTTGYSISTPGLNNNGDIVTLYDNAGNQIDQVSYTASQVGTEITFSHDAPSPTIQACSTTNTIQTTDLSTWYLGETRTNGHNKLTDNGLHVWNDSNTSTDKAAGYYPASFNLADLGEGFGVTTSTGSGTLPSLQLLVDLNNDGMTDGYLVGEPASYGTDSLWLSSNWHGIDLSGAPTSFDGGGTHKGGTVNAWLSAFPNAKVSAIGYSLGSGVHGDYVISNIFAGCTNYTFKALPPTAPDAPTNLRFTQQHDGEIVNYTNDRYYLNSNDSSKDLTIALKWDAPQNYAITSDDSYVATGTFVPAGSQAPASCNLDQTVNWLGGKLPNYLGNSRVGSCGDGVYSFTVALKNNVTGLSSSSVTRSITFDSHAPSTTLAVNGKTGNNINGLMVGNKFTVSGHAIDNIKLNRVYVQLVSRQDGQRYGGNTISLIPASASPDGKSADWSQAYDFNSMGLPSGKYAAYVTVVDMAGNTSSEGWTANFTVDTESPTADLSISGGQVVNNIRYVRPGDKITYKITNAQDTGGSGLDRASHIVFSVNSVGHQTGAVCGSWQNGQFQSNSDSLTGNFTMTECNGGTAPSDGTYAIGFRIYDNAGNNTRLTNERFTVDGTRPMVSNLTANSPASTTLAVSADTSDQISNGVRSGIKNVEFYLASAQNGVCKNNYPALAGYSQTIAYQSNGQYNASFNTSALSGQYCILAVAADNATNHNTPVFKMIVIDNTAPVATIDGVNPDGKTFNGSTGIHVHVTDDNYLQTDITRDDSTFHQTYVESKGESFGLFWLKNGRYKMVVTDKVGNSTTYNFTIERNNPTIIFVNPTRFNNVSYSKYFNNIGSIKINATGDNRAIDNTVIHIYNSDGSYSSAWCGATISGDTASCDASGLTEGNYYVKVAATDVNGNATYVTKNFTIDTTKPTITPINYTGDVSSKTFSKVSFSFYDAHNIIGFDLNGQYGSLSPSGWSNYDFPNLVKYFGLHDGLNTITAYDAAGNTSSYTFIFDSTAPFVNYINRFGSDEITNHNEVTFLMKLSEATTDPQVSDFSLNLTGSAHGTIDSVTKDPSYADRYYVKVTSVGGNGNLQLKFNGGGTNVHDLANNPVASDYAGQSYTIDNIAPVVSVTPGAKLLTGQTVFDVTVTDIHRDSNAIKNIWVYLYNVNDGSQQYGQKVDLSSGNGTFTVDTTMLSTGNYTLDVGNFKDLAGNNSDGTKTDSYFYGYTIDNTAPGAPVIGSADASSVSGTAEAGSTVTVTVNGSQAGTATSDNNGNWSLNFNPKYTTPDTYNVSATATDAAGNVSAPSAATTFYVLPTIFAQNAAEASPSGQILVTWTTNEVTTSRVLYDTVSHPGAITADQNDTTFTNKYGYANSTTIDNTKTTDHSILVSGLTPGTTYYFRAISHGSPIAVSDQFQGQVAIVKTGNSQTNDGTPVVNLGNVSSNGATSTTTASSNNGGTSNVLGDSTNNSGNTGKVKGDSTTKDLKTNGDTIDNSGAFLGLGWWWLLILAIIAALAWFIAGARRRADDDK